MNDMSFKRAFTRRMIMECLRTRRSGNEIPNSFFIWILSALDRGILVHGIVVEICT